MILTGVKKKPKFGKPTVTSGAEAPRMDQKSNSSTQLTLSQLFCQLINDATKECGERLRDMCLDWGRRELSKCVVLLEAVPNNYDEKTRTWGEPIEKDSRRGRSMCDPTGEPDVFSPVVATCTEELDRRSTYGPSAQLGRKLGEAMSFYCKQLRDVLAETNIWADGYVPLDGPCEVRVVLNVVDIPPEDESGIFMLGYMSMYYVTPLPRSVA